MEEEQKKYPETIKKFKVKTLTNQVYELDFDANMTVSQLKKKLAELSSVPEDRQRLVFMGKLLQDDQFLKNYLKKDEETIHMMARTEAASNPPTGQPPVSEPEPAQQIPQFPNLFAGFNPNAIFGQLGNISRAVMTSLGQPQQPGQPGQPDLGNIFVQISNSMFPGMPTQNVPAQTQPTNVTTGTATTASTAQTNHPAQQTAQIPQPIITQTQIPIVIPIPQQARPNNVQVPQQQSRPHHHPHLHPPNHPHLHIHPQQPTTVGQGHIVLPFQTLYQAGISINQLTGEGSVFPGPPLPQHGARNNAQVIGGFLSNWHFQMMRLLPFVYRLGEVLQREPGLNVLEHRQETNNLLTRITPIMGMMATCTTEVMALLNGFRLGNNVGQFSTTTQNVQNSQNTQNTQNVQNSQNVQNVPYQNQPATVSSVLSPLFQPPLLQPPPILQPTPLLQPPTIQPSLIQMPPGQQVTISAVIEEVYDGSQQHIPVQIIQQTTITVPYNQQNPLGFTIPPNIFSMLQPLTQPPQNSAPQSQPTQTVPPAQQTNQQPPSFQPAQPTALLNELGDVMRGNPMFGQLLSPNMIGAALGSNIREMFRSESDPNEPYSIYSLIFGDVSSGDLLSVMTIANFSFIDTRRYQIRAGMQAALYRFGNDRKALIDKMTEDILAIIADTEVQQQCMEGFDPRAVASDIIRKHLEKIIPFILSNESDFSSRLIQMAKKMIGYLLYEMGEGCENEAGGILQGIKAAFVRKYNEKLMGMAGIAFGMVEARIYDIYREYAGDVEREKQRSQEEVADETTLLKRIPYNFENAQDELKEFLSQPRSKHYGPQQ